jgi:hypothetical protein
VACLIAKTRLQKYLVAKFMALSIIIYGAFNHVLRRIVFFGVIIRWELLLCSVMFATSCRDNAGAKSYMRPRVTTPAQQKLTTQLLA